MKAIFAFILLAGVIAWLMFSGLFTHVLLTRQTVLQQEVSTVLETATQARYGYIAESVLNQSKQRLLTRGFDVRKLTYVIASTTGQSATDATHPIVRGEGIMLTIRYPVDGLLNINRFIGIQPPSKDATLSASGQRMSEYVFQGG
jgi:hypothetical protein